jgi:sugar lactone lactonase YvrE
VADRQNHRIRRVAPDGMVSTLAGTGIPGLVNGARSQAQFDSPGSVAVNTLGVVFVTEFESHTIRRIEADGSVSTLAGAASPGFVDATGSAARFDSPRGIGIDAAGQLVVADQGNHRLRAVAPDGMVTTLAGSGTPGTIDGLGTVARFDGPITVTTAPSAELLVAESGSSAIRRIASATSIVEVSTNLNGDTVLPVSLVISDVGSTCYFRASATNIAGTSVGAILSCRVEATPAFDTWAFNTFGADATNPQIAGLSANPDGDLHDNLQEFAFNLDPNAYSADPITIAYDGGAATLTYPRRTGATGLEYRVEWSTDRVVWKVEGVTETVPAGQAGGPTENVVATVAQSIVDTALANNLRIFIRVTITQL